jgi:hypothetical protein
LGRKPVGTWECRSGRKIRCTGGEIQKKNDRGKTFYHHRESQHSVDEKDLGYSATAIDRPLNGP